MNRRKWTEKEEKALLTATEWVEQNLDGESGQLVLARMGGKWAMISSMLKRDMDIDASPEACKSRFFNIRRREVHQIDDQGQETILFNDTDFVQVDVPQGVLELRVSQLEKEVEQLKKVASSIESLNAQLKQFFSM